MTVIRVSATWFEVPTGIEAPSVLTDDESIGLSAPQTPPTVMRTMADRRLRACRESSMLPVRQAGQRSALASNGFIKRFVIRGQWLSSARCGAEQFATACQLLAAVAMASNPNWRIRESHVAAHATRSGA